MLKVESFQELTKLLKIMRKQGVKTITLADMTIELNEHMPEPIRHMSAKDDMAEIPTMITANTQIQTPDALTEEQLLYYSSEQGVF